MLDATINEDDATAEAAFHDYATEKFREIMEDMDVKKLDDEGESDEGDHDNDEDDFEDEDEGDHDDDEDDFGDEGESDEEGDEDFEDEDEGDHDEEGDEDFEDEGEGDEDEISDEAERGKKLKGDMAESVSRSKNK